MNCSKEDSVSFNLCRFSLFNIFHMFCFWLLVFFSFQKLLNKIYTLSLIALICRVRVYIVSCLYGSIICNFYPGQIDWVEEI